MTPQEHALAERGAALVAAAVEDVSAPRSLREAIDRAGAQAVKPGSRRRRLGRLVLGPAGAFGIVLLLVAGYAFDSVVGGDGDTGHHPTVEQIAGLGARPASGRVPSSDGHRLNVSVEGVVFPDWTAIHWPPTGARTDIVNAREVKTVYYAAGGVTVAYSIVAGDQLKWPDGRDVHRGHEIYRVSHAGTRTTVTWTQEDHTCIVSSPSTIGDDKLVELASAETV